MSPVGRRCGVSLIGCRRRSPVVAVECRSSLLLIAGRSLSFVADRCCRWWLLRWFPAGRQLVLSSRSPFVVRWSLVERFVVGADRWCCSSSVLVPLLVRSSVLARRSVF
ncbi:hypothetical protein D8S78_24770 [Natrialba swarupiae]|nr:hypothetical protein [Natrialba swarupiae]